MHKECVCSFLNVYESTGKYFYPAGETVDYYEDETRLLFCVEGTDEIDIHFNHGLVRRDCEVMSLNGCFDGVHLLKASALSDEVSYMSSYVKPGGALSFRQRRDPLCCRALLLFYCKRRQEFTY